MSTPPEPARRTPARLAVSFLLLSLAGGAAADNGEAGPKPPPPSQGLAPPRDPALEAPALPGAMQITGDGPWAGWWRINSHFILPPRSRRSRAVTGDEAPGPVAEGGRTTERAVRSEILPTLLWAVDPAQRFSPEVVAAGYAAIAKAARGPEEVRVLVDAARPTKGPGPEARDAALLALGLLRRSDPTLALDARTLDLARTVCLAAIDDSPLGTRGRCLAAISLGLLADQPTAMASATSDPVPEALWGTVRTSYASDEIPVAALLGLAYHAPDRIATEVRAGLRQILLTGRIGKTTYGPLARSYALHAIARLEGTGAFGVETGILKARRFSLELKRAAAVGLGIAAPALDGPRRRIAATAILGAMAEAPERLEVSPPFLVALARLLAADLAEGSDALLRDEERPERLGRTPTALLDGLKIASVEVRPFVMLALSIAATRSEGAIGVPRFRDFRTTVLASLRRHAREGQGNPRERGAYFVGLGLTGDLDSIPHLRDAALDRNLGNSRASACEALGLLGRSVPDALDPLRRVLEERGASAWLLESAATALARLGGRDAPPVLLAKLDEGGSDSRRAPVLFALGRTEPPDAVQALVRVVRHSRTSDALRAIALQSLGTLADPGPLPAVAILVPGVADLPWTDGVSVVLALL